jgi:[protein-PII] uridylyltransferase
MSANSPMPDIPSVSTEELRRDSKNGVKVLMEACRSWFQSAHEKRYDALMISQNLTRMIDELIRSLFTIAEKKFLDHAAAPRQRATILALGGYGREELGLSSDIDLLFLYDENPDNYIRDVTDAVLYPLWDNGIEVGGATRTLADCIHIGEHDVRALTAMLDARFVVGDLYQAQRLFTSLEEYFSVKKHRERFIRDKLAEQENRLKRYGESIYLLEPNIKEGEGGLRDYHTLLWITKSFYPREASDHLLARTGLSTKGMKELLEGISFLWRIRHTLHLQGEKNDRLGFAQQEPIACALGYKQSGFTDATEQFMQAYYYHASNIHLQCQRALEQMLETHLPPSPLTRLFTTRTLAPGVTQIGRKLRATADVIAQGPSATLTIFSLAHRENLRLDAKTKEHIMLYMDTVEGSLPHDDETNVLWTTMLEQPGHLDGILADMLECRCLARWFPEMEPLIHQIQHDGYHFYTADEHSIRAVAELGNLFTKEGQRSFGIVAEALKKVKRLHVLTLATLLHDVGKGRGKGHAEIGTKLGKEIAKRLGWSSQDQETVAFLIRSHLLVPTLAFRRDIKDPHLTQRLAQIVETTEILAMLYLLAFADVRSMGPHIWSDWKGGLLTELYQNTLSHLEGGTEKALHQRLLFDKKENVLDLLGDFMSREELNTYFASMPDRYVTQMTPSAIASHLKMTGQLVDAHVVTEIRNMPERGLSELSIITHDAPGLFAKIAGVLSLNGIGIIDAQLFTLPNGTVIDLLWITDLTGQPLENEKRWNDIRKQLKDAITGVLDVRHAMKRQSIKRLLTPNRDPADTRIEIDNDVAPQETVVDVITHDRQGLLYDISQTFFELGCTIDRAKITTYADRVIDAFYIRDAKGEKITARDRLRQLQEAIANAVS